MRSLLSRLVNAIFRQNRTGCQWRCLPHDLPAWSAVFYYFTLWCEGGLDQRIQELMRCQVREKVLRLEDPSLVVIDTQSVRAGRRVPKTTTGPNANKRTSGHKRGPAVDVMGLIIGVVVLAASAHDNAVGTAHGPARPSGRTVREPSGESRAAVNCSIWSRSSPPQAVA